MNKLERQVVTPKEMPRGFWVGFIPTFLAAIAIMVTIPLACGGDAADPLLNGEACMADEACESMLCVAEFEDGVVVLDGMCTVACSFENDGADCVEGEICLRYNHTGEHYCFMECITSEDCREGWDCLTVGFVERACVPPLEPDAPAVLPTTEWSAE